MIKTTAAILAELQNYASPADKLSRLVKAGKYIPLLRGLYETDKTTPGYLVAGNIYGPSYLSFEFALSYYGMIPEAVYTYTSATFEKKKKKRYENALGRFTYQDVPSKIYPFGIVLVYEGEYAFQIAAREKAICDQLYKMHPVANHKALSVLLFDDLRIDQQELRKIDLGKLDMLSAQYPSTNVKKFCRLMRRWK